MTTSTTPEQPTIPITPIPSNSRTRPTTSMTTMRKSPISTRMLKLRLLSAVVVVSILASLALWIYFLISSGASANTTTGKTAHKQQTNNAPALSYHTQTVVENTAHQFMLALLSHHYGAMWNMLHPRLQAQWPSKTAYITFWNTRFQEYTFQNFKLGQARSLSFWVNPETMITYHQVEEVTVSLNMTPKASLQTLAALPPENAHPSALFQNLPIIFKQVTGPDGKSSQWRILAAGPADLEAPLLPPTTPTFKTLPVPILMYHHITNVPTTNVLDWSLTVTPGMFSQQLDYLKAQGYHTITFNQLLNALYYNGPLPSKPIILTFDDGYEDGYQFAYPILRQHGFSGMFYIITGKVNWNGQMTWPQLRMMLAHGMQMGSHTIHHVNIGQVLLDSLQQAQQELQISQLTLQQNLGIVVQHFCYPSGEPFRHGSLLVRQRVIALLAQDGYIDATTDPGMTGIYQQSNAPFVLLRIRVDGRASFLNFVNSIPA